MLHVTPDLLRRLHNHSRKLVIGIEKVLLVLWDFGWQFGPTLNISCACMSCTLYNTNTSSWRLWGHFCFIASRGCSLHASHSNRVSLFATHICTFLHVRVTHTVEPSVQGHPLCIEPVALCHIHVWAVLNTHMTCRPNSWTRTDNSLPQCTSPHQSCEVYPADCCAQKCVETHPWRRHFPVCLRHLIPQTHTRPPCMWVRVLSSCLRALAWTHAHGCICSTDLQLCLRIVSRPRALSRCHSGAVLPWL